MINNHNNFCFSFNLKFHLIIFLTNCKQHFNTTSFNVLLHNTNLQVVNCYRALNDEVSTEDGSEASGSSRGLTIVEIESQPYSASEASNNSTPYTVVGCVKLNIILFQDSLLPAEEVWECEWLQ